MLFHKRILLNKNKILNSKNLTNFLSDLNEQLNFVDLEIDNPIKKCENAIEISIKSKEN